MRCSFLLSFIANTSILQITQVNIVQKNNDQALRDKVYAFRREATQLIAFWDEI